MVKATKIIPPQPQPTVVLELTVWDAAVLAGHISQCMEPGKSLVLPEVLSALNGALAS